MLHRSPEMLVAKLFSALEGGYIREAGGTLSEDFTFSGAFPERLRKEQFLALHQALFDAMPDFSYNVGETKVAGDIVTVTVRITGTNLGEFNLPEYGLVARPATGKLISLPEEHLRARVHDGKITELVAEDRPDANFAGIFRQLGIEIGLPVWA